ncbi:MAG: efflux RND transporter periplasmic adaptor subunit [Bacteroidia bacterium]|nr:efflux RND transporter periplasmic adaptor subunit [Bacteroidia bacterium]
MKKRYILVPFFLVAIVFACKQVIDEVHAENATPVAKVLKLVKVAQVKAIEYENDVYAMGRLASKEEIKLSFKTGGLIKRMHAVEGQKVSTGKLLAELDLEEINAQVQQATIGEEQAEITLQNAELQVEKFERDYKDIKALYEDRVATLTELKDLKSLLDNARNQVKAAKTGLEFSRQNQNIASYNKRLSKIVAPSSGTILKRLAEPSEIVGPGTPIFIFGSSKESLVLKANVTDKDIVHLQIGNTATITFDAYPADHFNGQITEIAGIADPYTGTYEIEISLDKTNKKMLSGFIGEATIQSSNKQQLLSIPLDAMISANGDVAKVYTVDQGIVKSKTIKIGAIKGEYLVVFEGLRAGENVIIKGANYVSPNDSVNTEVE